MKKLITLSLALVATLAIAGELTDEFNNRLAKKYQRTGAEIATMSALELDGFPLKQLEDFKFHRSTMEFSAKLKNGDICVGSFVKRQLKFDCLNAAGIKTLQASGDSD